MSYGLIIVNEKPSPTFNVGDYIQALAAMQFLPTGTAPFLLERDNLSGFHRENERIKAIMNGWWMAKPKNFPPDESIFPLYRSFHLRPRIEEVFFSEETITHLQRYQPIGCRDISTARMMLTHGIKAYFSGCLTLTLGQMYQHQSEQTSPIYVVDPFVGKFVSKDLLQSINIMLRCILAVFIKGKIVCKIRSRIKETCNNARQGFDLWLYSTKICAIYSSVIGTDVLINGIYRTHILPSERYKSHEERLDTARHFLYEYSGARFVLTSRIHCGLPCLGIGTPVILVAAPVMFRSGRLEGIIDLFRSAIIKNGKCILNRKDFGLKRIDKHYNLSNKDKHMKFANELISDCRKFFEEESICC